jgi:hypothetical protein
LQIIRGLVLIRLDVWPGCGKLGVRGNFCARG